MRSRLVLVLLALVVGTGGAAAQESPPGSSVLPEGPGTGCVAAVARGDTATGLALCRKALKEGTSDPRVVEAAARMELEAGDPGRAAELYERLLQGAGWRWPWALGEARALWRDERPAETEEVLRSATKRDDSVGPYRELVAFLLSYSRWQDAAKTARTALQRFPKDCSLHEDLGVAAAGLGNDREAAEEIRAAQRLGCPPLRWTKRGEIPNRIERPEYRPLLDADVLARGLADLPEGEALHRLALLELVVGPPQAPALGNAAMGSHASTVKLAAMHLLIGLGESAVPQWRRILSSKDLMLRKHALRMLAREASPELLPVLEKHLETERAPHNLSLTKVAVARLLLEKGETARAGKLLRSIPDDDPSAPMARELLAKVGKAG